MLLESLVIAEQEGLVLLDRSPQGTSKLVTREMRDGGLIEEIARIKVAVAQEFKCRPVPIVCPGLGDNDDLTAGPFAILRAVSVAQQVEFPNRVHPQQLLAGTARLHIVLGRPREFDPV